MNTETGKTPKWIYVLIASVALNGLLAGLVISDVTQDKPEIVKFDSPHISPHLSPHLEGHQHLKSKPALHAMGSRNRTIYDNPRGLIAHLEPVRRRKVMTTAMKQIRKQNMQGPHDLLIDLRKSHKHGLMLLSADTLDEDALRTLLTNNRALKEKLAVQGDALVLEILKQLSPEERIGAMQSLRHGKRKRFKHKLEKRQKQQ